MPVSGPMVGSGSRSLPFVSGSGCTRKVARPSRSLRRKSTPRSACAQSCTTTYSSSSCRNSSTRFFEGRIDFHEIGQHAQRPEVLDLALFQRGEQALHRFGGVGAMRQHLFERLLARLQLGALVPQRFDAAGAPRRRSCRRLASSSSVRRRSPVTDSSSSWRCDIVSESDFPATPSRSSSAAAVCSSLLARARLRARCPPGTRRSA